MLVYNGKFSGVILGVVDCCGIDMFDVLLTNRIRSFYVDVKIVDVVLQHMSFVCPD